MKDNAAGGPVLRVLDANANRAREALRVIEDFARFLLNDDDLSARLKSLRHDFVSVTKTWTDSAILHRDTPGDVGTAHKTAAELSRASATEVVTAAGKRLAEALRAIEEFTKTMSPPDAAKIEKIRYRFYDIEQMIARTFRPATSFEKVRLYVLITEIACKRPWLEAAEAALAGGADCLQLREKTLDGAELLRRAKLLVSLCHKYKALSIINDRADIALLCGADGIHIGQEDLPTTEVRKLVGPDKIVGVSTHQLSHAKQAVLDGADYIGVGPIFRSPTKPREILPGLAYAAQISKEIKIPAVAIAGVTADNVDEVLSTGLRRVAITAAITGCDDVKAAAEAIKRKLIAAS